MEKEELQNIDDINSELGKKAEGERFIEFLLEGERYAFPLLAVREVLPLPDTTPIPKAPAYYIGLTNLRGHVISIMDLKMKMGIANTKESNNSVVLVVNYGLVTMGVTVDHITRVLNLTEDDISSPSDVQSKIKMDYMTGIHLNKEEFTVLLSLGGVLGIADLV